MSLDTSSQGSEVNGAVLVQSPGSWWGCPMAGRGQQLGGSWIGTVVAPERHSNCRECGAMVEGKHTLYGAWCLLCAVAEGERGPTCEL